MKNKLLHVSHIDLDGYGCQYIIKENLNLDKYNIMFKNSNYDTVDEDIREMIQDFRKGDMLLITDVNLTMDFADELEVHRDMIGFDLVLLDHHKSGEDVAAKYDWYYLDTSICATLITQEKYGSVHTQDIAKLIDVFDIYREEDPLFYRSTYLSNVVYDAPFRNKDVKRDFAFYMIENVGKSLLYAQTYIIEQSYMQLLNSFVRDRFSEYDWASSYEIPTGIKCMYASIEDMKAQIIYEDDDIILFKNINSSTFQYCSGLVLAENPDKCCINARATQEGKINISTRSKNDTAMNYAKKLGGGGHPNAGGAGCEDIDDVFYLLGINL